MNLLYTKVLEIMKDDKAIGCPVLNNLSFSSFVRNILIIMRHTLISNTFSEIVELVSF